MSDTNNDSNIGEATLSKGSISKKIHDLGQAEGRGSSSRPGLFVTMVEASKANVLGEDDVGDVWARYCAAVAKAQGKLGYTPMPSEAQQVSKLRVAIRLGKLPQIQYPQQLMQTVADQWNDLKNSNEGKPVGGSCFDCMVKVAREQLNRPDQLFSADEVRAIIVPDQKPIPEEADRLDTIVTAIEALLTDKKKQGKMSDLSREALENASAEIMTRIRELGGTSKMQAAAKKQAEKDAARQANLVMFQQRKAGPALQAAE